MKSSSISTIDCHPKVLTTVEELRDQVSNWRQAGETVALVPTMGALHEGHLSLVQTAQKNCRRTLVSIFVNPTQFGPGEDFERYPRNEKADLNALSHTGADAVYLPTVEEVYGPVGSKEITTTIHIKGLTEHMEGAIRRTHFDGVALVVCKLLLQCLPDVAVFGEKDYQQLQVVKRIVADLNIPTRILPSSLIRQPDGVAMSSRNAYLTEDQKRVAPWLFKTLSTVATKLVETPDDIESALTWGIRELYAKGFDKVDYLDLRSPDTLLPVLSLKNGTARLLAAARLSDVRLLDNIEVTARN